MPYSFKPFRLIWRCRYFMKDMIKKFRVTICFLSFVLCGCGADKTNNISYTEPEQQEVKSIDISGINPYAAAEIQGILDEIDIQITSKDILHSDAVIKQTLNVMGLAVGNSLVEGQTELVVKEWMTHKDKNELSEFRKKFETVYQEYEILYSEEAKKELKSAGLSEQQYDYCGIGRLDMVEWIYKNLN